MSNMPEIEAPYKKMDKQKENATKLHQRLNYCAYEAFAVNPFGKELLEFWHNHYICKMLGPGETNLPYHTAQTDFVRLIHGMITEHKLLTSGEKNE